MSRIGKKPILIPAGVSVIAEGQKITISGPKGSLSFEMRPEINFEIKEKEILLFPKIKTKTTNSLWGTSRTILANMIKGVTEGFEKKLEIEGIGYKAQVSNKNLLLYVGYSHPIEIKAPETINFSVDKNIITVSGINKELVGQIAAIIRKVKPAEPYKGKGIKYLGEKIRRKEGKKAVGAGAK